MKPKSQHWVPRFSLRQFATPESINTVGPQVWIFSKHEGEPQLTSVKNVATKHHLYSPKRKDGTRDWKMEEQLAGFESFLSRIWPVLATGFIDLHRNEALRKGVALFISTLHLRHPARINDIANIQARLVAAYEQLREEERRPMEVSSGSVFCLRTVALMG